MDALVSIVVTLVLLFVIGYLFLPKNSLYSRWRRNLKNDRKVEIENALKQLYDHEYNQNQATLDTLSEGLDISKDKTALVVVSLEEMKLAKSENQIILLTSEGRSYALRIIRIHRLWERYLADETSFREVDWHENAEHKEHEMTISEADDLAAKIGNPVYDPHGDPIPTSDGIMPKLEGNIFTDLEEGDVGTILHLEDEPLAVYSQLMALGLYTGMQLRVVEKSNERIKFVKDGEEAVLAPIFANNILVKKEEQTEVQFENCRTLSTLRKSESAKIVGLSGNCRGRQRRRLMDFGILPGTLITTEMVSPLGDPKAYEVRGTKIAIRKNQADQILIEKKVVA